MSQRQKLGTINSRNYELMTVQRNVDKAFDPLYNSAIVYGEQLNDLAVSTTATEFSHKLGRQPLGWIVVDKDADVRVWRTAWNSRTITLDASGSASISVWVY